MDLENRLEKSNEKNEKTVKIRVKLPHANKKSQSRKRIFAQTAFFHYFKNSSVKKFTLQNHSLFHSTSCFGVTKITTPI